MPNVPCHTTFPETLPLTLAKLEGTGKARPSKKMSSVPEIGTVANQVFVAALNEVVAHVAVGENVIWALGTGTL